MTKQTKQKNSKYLKPLSLYVGVNIFFFVVSYCGVKSFSFLLNQFIILAANISISLYIAKSLKITTLKRILFVVAASISGSIIGFLLILSTMMLPGSREHNHIMYDICLPAIRKHYGLQNNELFSGDSRHDKDGNGKWWYQHLECEENVRNGKGAVFSEEPIEFKRNVIK